MKQLLTFAFTLLLSAFLNAQTVLELYTDRNYKELIKLEKKADKLTADELYMVGYAFFQLENDEQAIACYNKAIEKGLDDGSVYFYKGLSLRYLKKYDEAMKEVETAIKKEPSNQEFVNEKGLIYYYQGKLDKALEVFEHAKKLPRTFPDPFFWVARIYHEKENFAEGLTLYYEALKNLPKENEYYLTTLVSIGQLEYTQTKDYLKSADAYKQAIAIDPKDYELVNKLIKSYNGAKEYGKADSLFGLLKIAYEKNELSEDAMKYKTLAIDEYEWKGQKMTVHKYLVDPKETLDFSYKVYLLNKAGDKVERTFMVEKTIELPEGAKHLLCEKDKQTGSHITYPYGWNEDAIPLEDLKKAVGLVLDEKMKMGASSNFGK